MSKRSISELNVDDTELYCSKRVVLFGRDEERSLCYFKANNKTFLLTTISLFKINSENVENHSELELLLSCLEKYQVL